MSMVAGSGAYLTLLERWRLTQYKWRYALEAQGFEPEEARRLIFLRWLRRARPWNADLPDMGGERPEVPS